MKTRLPIAAARQAALVLLALTAAPAAWASYGQMRLDGIAFALAAIALYFWSVLLAMGLAARLGRYRAFAIVATVVTVGLTALLFAVFADGRAAMTARPLRGPAMFVVLMLASVPVMLATPWWQFAGERRAPPDHRPIWVLAVVIMLAPVGSILYAVAQD